MSSESVHIVMTASKTSGHEEALKELMLVFLVEHALFRQVFLA